MNLGRGVGWGGGNFYNPLSPLTHPNFYRRHRNKDLDPDLRRDLHTPGSKTLRGGIIIILTDENSSLDSHVEAAGNTRTLQVSTHRSNSGFCYFLFSVVTAWIFI